MSSGVGPLIEGNYWVGDAPDSEPKPSWPYYDEANIAVDLYHHLMIFMAELSRLSAESMSDFGMQNPELIAKRAYELRDKLLAWWSHCPPALRDQCNSWRIVNWPTKLSVEETLRRRLF